jgi:hypothetical protein
MLSSLRECRAGSDGLVSHSRAVYFESYERESKGRKYLSK